MREHVKRRRKSRESLDGMVIHYTLHYPNQIDEISTKLFLKNRCGIYSLGCSERSTYPSVAGLHEDPVMGAIIGHCIARHSPKVWI